MDFLGGDGKKYFKFPLLPGLGLDEDRWGMQGIRGYRAMLCVMLKTGGSRGQGPMVKKEKQDSKEYFSFGTLFSFVIFFLL